MKLLIYFVATLTFSLSAMAQKPMTRTWRDKKESVAKLSYWTPERTWSSLLSVSYVQTSAKGKILGNKLGDLSVTQSTGTAELHYGIYPYFDLIAGWSYLLQGEAKVSNAVPPNVDSTSKSTGMSDPQIGVNWRALKTTTNTTFDFGLFYSPSLGKVKSATTNETGNNLRGGDLVTGKIAIISPFGSDFETKVVISRDYAFLAKNENGAERDPTGSTTLSGQALYDTDGGFYIGGGIAATMIDSSQVTTAGVKSDSKAYTTTAITVDLAADLNDQNGLTGSIGTVLPFSRTTNGVDYDYNTTIGVNVAWIHQF